MPNFKSEKLRVNLRLCINRLKLLEKKKSEFLLNANYFKHMRWSWPGQGYKPSFKSKVIGGALAFATGRISVKVSYFTTTL